MVRDDHKPLTGWFDRKEFFPFTIQERCGIASFFGSLAHSASFSSGVLPMLSRESIIRVTQSI